MLRLLIAALTSVSHAHRNGAAHDWLDHLDARTLRDIGMTRHEIELAMRRSGAAKPSDPTRSITRQPFRRRHVESRP